MELTTTSCLCTWLVAACMSITCDVDHTITPHAMFSSSKDFFDCYFASLAIGEGFENFSLGKEVAVEVNRGGDDRRRSVRYGSSGLEMYSDCSEELSMIALDFIHGFNHHLLPLHVACRCLHVRHVRRQLHQNPLRNVPLVQDFSNCYFSFVAFDEGFENFSLGKGVTTEVNHVGGNRRRSLQYGSNGMEMYGNCSEELSMIVLDLSEIIGFNHRIEELKGQVK